MPIDESGYVQGHRGNAIPDTLLNISSNGLVYRTGANTYNAGNLSGDITTSALVSTLATVNVTPSTYAIATVTVNGKGLVTSATAASTTGSGSVVLATSPTLVTPVLGVATATSISFGETALSNYVEGTFNATLTPTTLGNWSVVYTSQSCNYTRLGNRIIVDGRISCTPTFTTASGSLAITGLPVTANSGRNSAGIITTHSSGIVYPAGTTWLSLFVDAGTTQADLQAMGSASNTASITTTNIASGAAITIYFHLEYMA